MSLAEIAIRGSHPYLLTPRGAQWSLTVAVEAAFGRPFGLSPSPEF